MIISIFKSFLILKDKQKNLFHFITLFLSLFLSFIFSSFANVSNNFVTIHYGGQLGNQLFQTAAAYSLALDNNCSFIIPQSYKHNNSCQLKENMNKIFWRFNFDKVLNHVVNHFHQPEENNYVTIPFSPKMCLTGFFESEKFFYHNKDKILKMFAPSKEIIDYLNKKYSHIIQSNKTVGIHIRTYYNDWLITKNNFLKENKHLKPKTFYSWFPAPDICFYEKAIMFFPLKTTFVVFSDNISWCKKFLSHIPRHFIFIEGEKQYHDLYLLSMCKHQIIANSTFAWWAAYLNKNPYKMVIVRANWTIMQIPRSYKDIIPSNWITLEGTPHPVPAIFN